MSLNLWNQQPYPAFSVAPMLDVTDRHFRYFLRLLSRHALLYTEMITTGALLYGKNPERFLDYSAAEHPVALQLGGGNPDELARATRLATQWGYDEINLNVGCPSDRVQNNAIGACLMLDPQRVADCFQAIQENTDKPVSIKCRLGVDQQDEESDLEHFIQTLEQAGCRLFIVHARKAWLQGLSPKQNRDIPPLNYARVQRLKQTHPNLVIAINGGLGDLQAAHRLLDTLDGVMLGRAIWNSPYLLAAVDSLFFGAQQAAVSQHQAVRNYLPYVEQQLQQGTGLQPLIRPLINLFQAVPGARRYRRILSEQAHLPGAGPEVILNALSQVSEESIKGMMD